MPQNANAEQWNFIEDVWGVLNDSSVYIMSFCVFNAKHINGMQ